MDREEKIKYIFDAIKNGVSKRQIDFTGKGISIKRLEENKPVTDEKIDEMFKRAEKLIKEKVENDKESTFESNVSQGELNYFQKLVINLTPKIELLEKRVLDLENDNCFLHKQLLDVTLLGNEDYNRKNRLEIIKGCRVFWLAKKTTKTGGRSYRKWYAKTKEDGKEKWIYVGNEIAKAEEKIDKWLKKR